MLLKGMAESSLLPKDQPLTPNIDRVMGFENGESWTSQLEFLCFLSAELWKRPL